MNLFAFNGSLGALSEPERSALLKRPLSQTQGIEGAVRDIIDNVKARGDAALFDYAQRFDGATLAALQVPQATLQQALDELEPSLRRAFERAATNLRRVALATMPQATEVEVEPGVIVGRRADPLQRVGVYAPGGTAAYPSSVLMGVVPAKAAGVPEVIVCSPPAQNGLPSKVVMAAACLAGADAVFAVGGAGAVAAMAYGTASVAPVQRIVGPGNAWVAEAKRQVAADVGIDSPAGPSELLVIADAHATPSAVALEVLAQAEHDVDACVVVVALDAAWAQNLEAEIGRRLSDMPRAAIASKALQLRGALLTATQAEAISFSNAFAPEHLLLALTDADAWVPKLFCAGTIFVGETASVSFGDYLSGANHVLPTAGHARKQSGLSVFDFVRFSTWQRISKQGANSLAADVVTFASSEGLFGHAASAAQWKSDTGGDALPASTFVPFRSTLSSIERYVPKRPPMEIDLTDNTNLFGVPPHASEAIAQFPSRVVTRYPSPYADTVRKALARYAEVQPDNVITGCGSDDVLDALFRAFGNAGDQVAYAPPTFGIIPAFAKANALQPVETALSTDSLLRVHAKIIYLCSPNNPTGALLSDGFVETLLRESQSLVVLDEAYIEYASRRSLSGLAAQSPRLVVVRTLSKAFGLAGLRIGWAVAHARVVAEIEKTRGPYKVGGLTEMAAVAALTDDLPWVQSRVAEVKQLRLWFTAELKANHFSVLPSEANFVLVPTTGISCLTLADRMRDLGVSVRAFPKLQGIGDALRISIGPKAQMVACLNALKEVSVS
jgi:histidinol dehydrogenase